MDTLDEKAKAKTIKIFLKGFKHIFSFTDDIDLLSNLFLNSLDFNLAYVAIIEGNVVGLICISNNKIRPFKIKLSKCNELFGEIEGPKIYNQLYSMMGEPAVHGEKDIYIDFVTTDNSYRGHGIGTKLIDFVCNELGYEVCYLEVISNNVVANRLYNSIGFKEFNKDNKPPILIEGVGYLLNMIREPLVMNRIP